MKTVDIHELVEHIDETLRLLKESGETGELAVNGEFVARLLPPLEQQTSYSSDDASDRAWANLERLSAEIGKHWTSKICENLAETNDGEVIAHFSGCHPRCCVGISRKQASEKRGGRISLHRN